MYLFRLSESTLVGGLQVASRVLSIVLPMADVVLISLPADRNPDKAFKELHAGLARSSPSSIVLKFDVPTNIKVFRSFRLIFFRRKH